MSTASLQDGGDSSLWDRQLVGPPVRLVVLVEEWLRLARLLNGPISWMETCLADSLCRCGLFPSPQVGVALALVTRAANYGPQINQFLNQTFSYDFLAGGGQHRSHLVRPGRSNTSFLFGRVRRSYELISQT